MSPVIASRSWRLTNRQPINCRLASECRFQRVQVVRFSATVSITACPTSCTTSSGTSSARSIRRGASPRSKARAQPVASVPSSRVARSRQSRVRSASDLICFSGRGASVSWARSFSTIRAEGCRPCLATYSAISRSFSTSICCERVENSVTSSSGTPSISHAGLRSRPRSRASHPTPKVPVSRSARAALYSSDMATTAACIGRPARVRQRPSCAVRTLLLITTWVCNCGSPERES